MPKVKEIMKSHVITIGPEVPMSKIAKILTNNRVGSVVIVRDDKPVNIITTNDIVTLVAHGKDLDRISAEKYIKMMKKPFLTVAPDLGIMELSKKMIKTGRKRFPVVENGRLRGIVSTKEVLLVSPELIEILSERLKSRMDRVANPEEKISGMCESCDSYSDELRHVNGNWICPDCNK